MISKKLESAINEQIKNELYSGYLYLAMAAYCEDQNLSGFANWMKAQAKEETGHAFKLYGYIYDQGGRVVFQAIDQPPADFGSPLQIFEETLKHEQKVTAMINNLYGIAVEEKDYASQGFLQWFISEQVEEEKSVQDVINDLMKIGDSKQGLFMLDRQLGSRQ